MKTQVLDPKHSGSYSKDDWHSLLNFRIVVTEFEENIFEFDIYFVKDLSMKNIPFVNSNALTVKCRL
jgi:hypothetical protein